VNADVVICQFKEANRIHGKECVSYIYCRPWHLETYSNDPRKGFRAAISIGVYGLVLTVRQTESRLIVPRVGTSRPCLRLLTSNSFLVPVIKSIRDDFSLNIKHFGDARRM
jgi:hypothetical protein